MIYSVDKIENGVAALVGDDGLLSFIDVSRFGFIVKQHDILIFDEDTETFRPDDNIRDTRENDNKKRLR